MDRILVVDDSALMVMNMRSVLKRAAWRVHTARDGSQAMANHHETPLDGSTTSELTAG